MEERRAAALDLLLSAVRVQPSLIVVLFWAQLPPNTITTLMSPPPKTGSASGGTKDADSSVKVGGAALSGAVVSALTALSSELPDGKRGLAGGSEALVTALDLVSALWHAEGVGRLGQVGFLDFVKACVDFFVDVVRLSLRVDLMERAK